MVSSVRQFVSLIGTICGLVVVRTGLCEHAHGVTKYDTEFLSSQAYEVREDSNG